MHITSTRPGGSRGRSISTAASMGAAQRRIIATALAAWITRGEMTHQQAAAQLGITTSILDGWITGQGHLTASDVLLILERTQK